MKGFFDDQSIDIACSKGHETAKSVGWLKANDRFNCPVCGQEILLARDDLLRGIRDAEKQLRDFGKGLR